LRVGPEVDAAVGQRDGFVFDQQFNVAVGLVGGQVSAVAIVDEFAVLHGPVLLAVGSPFVGLGQGFDGGHLLKRAAAGAVKVPAVPTGEIFAVEDGGEALGRLRLFGTNWQAGDYGGGECGKGENEHVSHETILDKLALNGSVA